MDGGRIRPARRPAGWKAPGSRPTPPAATSPLWPGPGEDLCHLAGDWRILQKRSGHRWSLDDLVTAAVAADGTGGIEPRRILDLGCGIGAVLLLLAWRFPRSRALGVEVQAASAALARRSIAWNGGAERCEVRIGDLRDPSAFEPRAFDLVTATPPYLAPGSATPPRRAEQPGCHLELRGGIDDYVRAAARALAPGGRFVVCHNARERVLAAASTAGLAIESVQGVIPRAGKAPLFAVYGMRLADGERVNPPALASLVVRDAEGRRSADFVALRERMGMPP